MKLKLFFLIALVCLVFHGHGQIKMDSNGDVGIGTITTTYKLGVTGSSYFNGDVGIGVAPHTYYKFRVVGYTRLTNGDIDFYVNNGAIEINHDDFDEPLNIYNSSGHPVIRHEGDEDDIGYLGTSLYQWYRIYTDQIWSNGGRITSDIRLKENIRNLESPLEKLMNIRGVKFDYITKVNPDWEESRKNEYLNSKKDLVGFIAQEVEEVFPELVDYDVESDKYAVDYNGMIPVLLEAIKEQQTLIEELQSEVEQMKSEENLKSESVINPADETLESNTLFQNTPNPFSESTEIKYYISDEVQNAFINIYDLAGTQIKSVELYQKENGSISISGGELDPGIYVYTLLVDGNLIDIKQMVLTD